MKKKYFRLESDIIGKKKVLSNKYYGIQTARASEIFSSGQSMHTSLKSAILQIKIASAMSNSKLGVIEKRKANAIIRSCKKILRNGKKYESSFILPTYQAGAGTSWHMNVNEVIANVALELIGRKKGDYKFIDPHNHVNASQSTNDVMPTAMRIASIKLTDLLIIKIKEFVLASERKSKEFRNLLKSSRTHMQDAVPITLGLEFGAWASDINKRLKTIIFAKNNLRSINLGGSAVGTGLNVPKDFAKQSAIELNRLTNLKLSVAKNKIEETQFMSDFLDLSATLRTLVTDLTKIANDLRLLSSGPRTGLNEIKLPKVVLGSSIMPFKFNPSMAEMLNMVCFQVIGNDQAIQQATEAGQLELNVMTPVIAHNLLESLDLLTTALDKFTNKCLIGITANKKELKNYFENSSAIATVLSPIIGYDETANIMKESSESGKSLKSLLIEKKLMDLKKIKETFSRENFRI